jgi:nitronate monooxygenase
MRGLYALRAMRQLKNASLDPSGAFDFWQAGRSVAGIHAIEPAGEIVRRFARAAETPDG